MQEDSAIAVIAPVQPEEFFDQFWQGVWEATFDIASFGIQVQNLTTERHDVDGQAAILTRLLAEHVNAIAILPAHGSALNALINQHESLGTPVVTFHGDAPESQRSAYVGPDPYHAGVLAAEALTKFMGGRGRAVCLPGALHKHHLAQRYRGFRAELASYPECSLIEIAPPRDLASADADALEQLSLAQGIYVGDEQLADVAKLLEAAGISAPCVGFGNTEPVQPFLVRKTVSAVISEHRYLQGYFAVQKAHEAMLKRERGLRPESVHVPCTVSFATNRTDSLWNAFEILIRQRTEVLCSYKQRLEQANAELLSLSVTDALTGLLNRRRFQEVLENEVARSRRYGPLSLLIIDLDFFKQVNDQYGHPAGDEALKCVAAVLKTSCRVTDFCARLGGDEFAVILPHADGSAADIVRDRILRSIAEASVPAGETELRVSLSIGMSTLAPDGDAEQLVAAADADMYRVKQASRSVPALSR